MDSKSLFTSISFPSDRQPIQSDPANEYKFDPLIEMAAEQFARILLDQIQSQNNGSKRQAQVTQMD